MVDWYDTDTEPINIGFNCCEKKMSFASGMYFNPNCLRYPFPAFVNACVFFFSRVKYAFDYTNATADRNTGFAIYGMAQACLETRLQSHHIVLLLLITNCYTHVLYVIYTNTVCDCICKYVTCTDMHVKHLAVLSLRPCRD